MLTRRGQIICLLAALGAAVGCLRTQYALLVLSLSILLAVFVTWVSFEIRYVLAWRRLHCQRTVGGSQEVTTLWAGREFDVRLQVICPTSLLVVLRDLVPPNVTVTSGEEYAVSLDSEDSFMLLYRGECPSAGIADFFGVHFSFTDRYGLFACQRTFSLANRMRVLPAFSLAGDRESLNKRLNAIPQQGIHQLKRTGMGAELLELKEYQPGDPPKSIAWKASARRGQLMTRQYESEVPIRVTVLMDDSGAMRSRQVANGPRPIDQLCSIAATVAKQSVSVADRVGLSCIARGRAKRKRPVGGERGLYGLLDMLAEYASLQPPGALRVQDFRYAVQLCQERYPDLLESRLSSFPFSFFPLLPGARQQLLERRQLATVLAESQGLRAGEMLRVLHDPAELMWRTERWLKEQGLPLRDPRMLNSTVSEEQSLRNFERLAQEFSKLLSLAKDNEVFVVCADLLQFQKSKPPEVESLEEGGTPAELDALLAVAKVALGRHHRVIFLSPSAFFGGNSAQQSEVKSRRKSQTMQMRDVASQVQDLVLTRQMRSLKRKMRGIGATLAFLDEVDVASTVLAEVGFVRSGRLSSGRRSG